MSRRAHERWEYLSGGFWQTRDRCRGRRFRVRDGRADELLRESACRVLRATLASQIRGGRDLADGTEQRTSCDLSFELGGRSRTGQRPIIWYRGRLARWSLRGVW